jgi:ADP-heptose:LPS heptosyltransferase
MATYLLRIKNLAPGDILMATGLARDLHRATGGKHRVGVSAKFHDTRRHSPYIDDAITPETPGVQVVDLTYKIEWFQKKLIHFCQWPHRAFEQATGIPVPLTEPHADIHIQPDEAVRPAIQGRYWIVVPGGKVDMPIKIWSQVRFQEVVDKLRARGLRFVQEGSTKSDCRHPALRHVTNVVGLTSLRDFICNIRHADGVICAESFPMHAAAALHKPCVVLAGGRVEPWSFEYSNDWDMFKSPCAPVTVPHRFLHTLKLLDCCRSRGCWTQRLTPLRDGNRRADRNLCKQPVTGEERQPVAKCLDMITTEHVLDAVQWYYDQGFIAK